MTDYLIRRVLGAFPILFGVVLLTFILLQMIPGDAALVMAGEHATPEQVERMREELGLNRPLPVQFAHYLGRLVQFDLGRSVLTDRPVAVELRERFPATLELSLAAMLIAAVIGVSLGALAAAYKHTWVDACAMAVAMIGVSIPIFWLGVELIYLLSYQAHLFPIEGRGYAPAYSLTGLYTIDAILSVDFAAFSRAASHLFLPALTLGLLASALMARMTRATLIEILEQDFIRTVRAKGTGAWRVWRHAFAAGFVPILTVFGLQLGMLLGGAVLTESVYSWPGLGSFLVQAVFARDMPSIQTLVLLSAAIFVAANLVVDLLAGLFDPRLRQRFQTNQ
ncbi:MAG: ABC transporter permease subunit [bacterium]|nr:ABC transporter permease subunit [bacterium]